MQCGVEAVEDRNLVGERPGRAPDGDVRTRRGAGDLAPLADRHIPNAPAAVTWTVSPRTRGRKGPARRAPPPGGDVTYGVRAAVPDRAGPAAASTALNSRPTAPCR